MQFLLTLSIGIFLGMKFQKALIIYKETKNINYIKSVVEQVINKESVELVDLKPKKKQEEKELEKEFEMWKRYKMSMEADE